MEALIIPSLMILVIPLFTFLLLGLFGKKLTHRVAGAIGTTALSIVAMLSLYVAYNYFFNIGRSAGIYPALQTGFEWFRISETLQIDIGVLLDPISVMMLLVISLVSLMVHIYSLGYMNGERGFQRYFAFLSLFTFSMLGLVVATNIFQMYIFWELVGVSSYLLIGFYYTKPSAVAAAKKAFIVTRFADLGFLTGILILSFYTKTFDFSVLTDTGNPLYLNPIKDTFMGFSVISWATLLIFTGGAGKSAMLPLHIWLPDAMEGPTPVSALIHAATMVVAGVYLVARLFPVYYFLTPQVLLFIGILGAATALYAAIVACTQTDIKRVLAFSTISQIAYMLAALGVSGYVSEHEAGLGYMASMFHLFTHAFFKALLFLGAGAVIHAVHSNEMGDMGGLRRYLPVTNITFLIACLSISGIPPFSGFFSKDEILVAAFSHNTAIFICLLFVAGLTAFYMFRLYFSIFWNKEREYHKKPHDPGVSMLIPLLFLALVTLFGGLIPFGDFVSADRVIFESEINWSVAIPGVLIAIGGISLSALYYFRESRFPAATASAMGRFYKAASAKFYFDEIYLYITKRVIFGLISTPIAWFDRHIVDGFMDWQATWSNTLSAKIKGFQSGKFQEYAWIYALSLIVIAVTLIIYSQM